MKKVFGTKQNNKIIVNGEEILHLAVLRCSVGEQCIAYTGDENEYICEIEKIDKKQAELKILQAGVCKQNPQFNITLFQGLPKGDKLDLIVQKATELGASHIVTFESAFTIAKPNNLKIDRLNKISKEACKQCGRSLTLKVHPAIKFDNMIDMLGNYDLVLLANEKDKFAKPNIAGKNIAVIVGSEGGFSEAEIKKLELANLQKIGLGSRILRTETASIALLAIISYQLNN